MLSKFAVEGCLAEARTEAREKDAPLRARELEINAVERKESGRTPESHRGKGRERRCPHEGPATREGARKGIGPQGPGAKPDVDEAAAHAQRQSEAQQRAAKQSDYVRRHEQNRAHADEGRAEREAKARADFEAKQKRPQRTRPVP